MRTTENSPPPPSPRPARNAPGGLLAAALLAAAFLLPAARAAWAGAEPEVVYGPDNRREVFGLRGAQAAAAAGTVALVGAGRLRDNGDGTSRLLTVPFSASRVPVGQSVFLSPCPGQRFLSQPTAPFCSGVLVGPDVVATAGHCITSASELAGTRFVFGFQLTNARSARTTIPNGDVYRGAQLLARQDSSSGDFAVVRLDRRVAGRVPLRISSGGPPAVGTPLYVIGHPSGLPAKIAAGASVARATRTFFAANLDTFGGNSGSPVFDARGNTVLGLLSSGAPDYRPRGSCAVVNVLPDAAGGENVSNAGGFAAFVPQR